MIEEFYLGIYWNNQVLTAREYLSFAKEYLTMLQKLDPIFHRFYSWGSTPTTGTWLKEDLRDFNEVVLEHINNEDIRYENPDRNNWDISLEAKSPIGFRNSFSNYIKDEKKISVSISVGSSDITDTNSIVISFKSYLALKNLDFISNLIQVSLNYAKPKYAVLISHEFGRMVEHEDDEVNLDIGWLTYFADKSIAQYLPSDTDYEILPEGGVLIKLKDEMPSAENQQDVNAAIKIRDSLVNNGITDWEQLTHKA